MVMDFEQFKKECRTYVEISKDDSGFSVENYGFCYEVVGAIKIMHFPGAHRRYSAWLVKLIGLGVASNLGEALRIAEKETKMIEKIDRGDIELNVSDEF